MKITQQQNRKEGEKRSREWWLGVLMTRGCLIFILWSRRKWGGGREGRTLKMQASEKGLESKFRMHKITYKKETEGHVIFSWHLGEKLH